jgi:hypothetical protein
VTPRIRLIGVPAECLRRGVRWLCISDCAVGFGASPLDAYADWSAVLWEFWRYRT